MRFVLTVLVFCVGAVALAWYLSGLPGMVTLTLSGLTIETSTPIALVVLAVAILVLLLVLRLLRWVLGTGTRTGRWRRRRRREGGDEAVTGSLVALAAGDALQARRESDRARRLLGDTPQTLLLAAQSARLAGQEAAAAELYGKLAERPDAALLGLRGLLRQAIAREEWTKAAEIAGRAEAASPGSPWLREERMRLAARSGDWQQALSLAAPDSPRAAFAVAAADAATSTRDGLRLARSAWKGNRGFAPAAIAYARRLREAGKEHAALEVLRETWARAPQPDLAAMALASAASPADRLRRAARLVSGQAEHAESHLLLARLELEAGGAAAARRHLEAVRRSGLDQRRVWVLLADVEAQGGEAESARMAQRDALRRAAGAPPDPAWRCEACGTVVPEWRPTCPSCHRAGRIAWGVGPQPELLLAAP
jgi:HemY protein